MFAPLVIAGASSGVGKTTITTGLIAALRRRGLRVQPFKAGPDYIDPTYHTLAAGRTCRNIDTWLTPPDRALALFNRAARHADIAIIEGVMGIFDGFSYTDETGSTAEIAKLLQSPVLLILDVGKMARSAGALALGYSRFDPDLNIAGFILNRCGSESHYQGVKEAVEQACLERSRKAAGIPVVGWLPRDAGLHIPERHLGLVPTDERGELTNFIANTADAIEQYFDLDKILDVIGYWSSPRSNALRWNARFALDALRRPARGTQSASNPSAMLRAGLQTRIAVARDAAFSFYYEDNLDLLREAGAEILFFSPLADATLPPAIGGLYIGGGFPEVYAARLAANRDIKAALGRAHSQGMPIYAECGGFMYLTEAIVDLEGRRHSMVGLVPGTAQMQPHLVSLGYRLVEPATDNFLLPQGERTRGHEFHWSTWQRPAEHSPAWRVRSRQGQAETGSDGYARDNLLASYIHLHFAHNLQLAQNFARACQRWQEGQSNSAPEQPE